MSSETTQRERPARVHAIDLLRLVASVQMIAGHTISALLAPSYQHGRLFEAWMMVRGLTAVAFMFAAGAAFSLVAAGSSPARAQRRRRRAVMIILLGYALHPPAAAFGGDPEVAARAWRDFFAVDVLSCIGVTLLVLEGLLRTARFRLWAGALALFVIFVSPLAATIEPSGVLLPFANYLSRRAGSLFPLTPFAGFVLAGAALGPWLFHTTKPLPRLLLASVVLLAAGWTLRAIWPQPADDYHAWPAVSLLRLGAVLAGTTVLALATSKVERLPHWITVLAGQSLFLYVSHLLVLYGAGIGLVSAIGPTLSLVEALLAASAMIVLAFAGALLFARWVTRR